MSLEIDRFSLVSEPLTVTSSEATSAPCGFGSCAGATLYCVSTSTSGAITISWRAKFNASSPVYKLHDSTNTALTATIQPGRCYDVPQELFGALQIMAVADTAGQTAVVRFSAKG